ncbi:MAG TPA: hypothetical protein VFZ16_17600 [Hyphomicrobiaceae bacterium]|nr:hypothetical protein [Hyphomicrobiaceae bacterium]
MPVKQLSIDTVRERFPHLLRQAREHVAKLPLPRPSWPVGGKRRMHWLSWRTLAAGALLGGVVHIFATFAAPNYTAGHAFRKLSEKLPVNSMVVLPPQAPGEQILPYLPGGMRYAMCRFNLREGPLSVVATVLGPGWSLSVHTPEGTNFYVLPGQAARHIEVSFLLVPTAPDLVSLTHAESEADSQVDSPELEGVVVLRAPSRGIAWTAETEAILQHATCTHVPQR